MNARRYVMIWWFCLVWVGAGAGSVCAEVEVSAQSFRISGIAVNSLSDSPIPFCHLTGVEIPDDEIVRPRRRPEPNQGIPPTAKMKNTARAADENKETTADAQGRFMLVVPKAGAWRITAKARGYRTQAYDEHEEFSSAVVLTETAPTMSLRFGLVPDASVSGGVRDEAGEPVEGAQVIAELLLPKELDRVQAKVRSVAFVRTDDRGQYELSGLAAGEYRIRVQARPWYAMGAVRGRAAVRGQQPRGLASSGIATPESASLDPSLDVLYAVTWFPGTDDAATASLLRLRGGESQVADVHLTAIPAVHLQMTRSVGTSPETGVPLETGVPPRAGAQRPQRMMTIARVSSEGWSDVSGAFSPNGTDWDFGGLAPGTYEVKEAGQDAAPDAEVRQIELQAGGSGYVGMQGSVPLTEVSIVTEGVPDGEVEQVVFVDTETGRRITSSAGTLAKTERAARTVEKAMGARIAMLPPHRYQVYVFGRGKTYLTGLTAAGSGVKTVGRVVEIAGAAVKLTVHLAKGNGEVMGFAQLEDRPDAGATVLLVPATLGEPQNLSFVHRDQTNTDGSFVLHGVMPGKYILIAIDHGWQVNWRDTATLTRYLSHGVPVEIEPTGHAFEEIQAQNP